MKDKSFEKSFFTGRFVWALMLISLFAYGIIAFMLKQFVMAPDAGFIKVDSSTYLMVLTIFSLAGGLLGYVALVPLARRQAPEALIERNAPLSLQELARLLMTGQIIRIWLTEVIAVLGLVLFLLNGRIFHLGIFLSIALLVHLLIFPRRAAWEAAERLWRRRKMQ